jgi:anti-sigma-K factor RskA
MDAIQHVINSLPEYILETLDETGRSQVTGHLEKCPACQAELDAYQTVVDQLALAVPLFSPPETLKHGLVEQFALPAARPRAWTGRLQGILTAPIPAWGLVIATLLLILSIAACLLLWRQNQQLLASHNNDFLVNTLKGTNSAPSASGWIVTSRDGYAGTLIVQGLPPLTTDEQYQLWLYKGTDLVNGGLFQVNNFGYGSVQIFAPEPLNEYSRIGVTVEPEGGSLDPTGAKVLINH